MAYHFEFDAANRILRSWFDKRVDARALREYYLMAAKYDALARPRAAVLDFTLVSVFDVSPETIRDLAELAPAFPDPKCERIIIAPSSQIFGLARMFQLHGQDTRPNLHVVRTAEEAWALLGAKDVRFEPLELKSGAEG